MIKLKDILNEEIVLRSVDAVLVTDKDVNYTDTIDGIRGVRKITTVNTTTSDELECPWIVTGKQHLQNVILFPHLVCLLT